MLNASWNKLFPSFLRSYITYTVVLLWNANRAVHQSLTQRSGRLPELGLGNHRIVILRFSLGENVIHVFTPFSQLTTVSLCFTNQLTKHQSNKDVNGNHSICSSILHLQHTDIWFVLYLTNNHLQQHTPSTTYTHWFELYLTNNHLQQHTPSTTHRHLVCTISHKKPSAAAYSIYNTQTFGLYYISQTTICSSILHLQHTDIWFVLYLTNNHLQQHTPSTTHRHLVCTISHKQPSAAAYSIYNTQTFGLYYISQTTICSSILHLQHTDIWLELYLTNNHLQQHTPSTTHRHLVCTISHKQPSAAAYSIYNTQTFGLYYISQTTICSSILHLQHTDIWFVLYLTNNHLQQHTPSTTHRHLVCTISHKQPSAAAYSIYNTQTFGLYYISQTTICSSILHLQHTDIWLELYLTNNHLQQHTPSTTHRHLVCTISHKQPSVAAYSIYNTQTFGLYYISQTTICSSILHLQHTDIWFVLYLTNNHLQQHTPSTTHRHLVCTISHKQPSAAAYSIYNTQTFGLYYISQITICSSVLHLQHTDIWFVLYLTNNHLQQRTPSTTHRHLVCTISHK